MMNFLLCGLLLLLYALGRFHKRILYPSIVFGLMWGFCCIYTAAIIEGYGENLFLKDIYSFKYMDTYIIYFTIASLLGFSIAHKLYGKMGIHLKFSLDFIDRILTKYKFIMWLNFFGGLIRIFMLISAVGFDLNNVMDYRLAANKIVLYGGASLTVIIFRITGYIQMLANFYIALYGLRVGFGKIDIKKMLKIFILYSPTQLATGGRLFVLYFVIFFFGSFFLGRGISMTYKKRKWFLRKERRAVALIFSSLIIIVALIGMSRNLEEGKYVGKESFVEKFAYITEGMLLAEYGMQQLPDGSFQQSNGAETVIGGTDNYWKFRAILLGTKMSSSVICIIFPLYLDFGYWGSLIAWFFIALFIESLFLNLLSKLTMIRFFILTILLKIIFETVLTNSIYDNIPVYQLIILFALFYKPLFGRFKRLKYDYEGQ